MNLKQVYQTAVVGVLWLCLGVGCHHSSDPTAYVVDPNDPTARSCNDNTCCGQDNGQYDYVEYIQDAPGALVGPPTISGWGLIVKNPLPSLNIVNNQQVKARVTLVAVCDLSVNKVNKLKISTTSLKEPSLYNYRISGKVFQLPLTNTFSINPILAIYVDKIELIN